MAQLRRAKKDGHLFILAGRSQGTWQVSKEGEVWLRAHHCDIPKEGESVHLDAGTFARLRDENYLFTYGTPYDHNQQDEYFDEQAECIKEGFPLLLRWKGSNQASWELIADLAELIEDVWQERHNHHATFISISGSSRRIKLQPLKFALYYLPLAPRPQPYNVYGEDQNLVRQKISIILSTPGLNDNWQGNVFTKSSDQADIWRRQLPESTITFSGEVLWLVNHQEQLEWPGRANPIGLPYEDWQLWHLTLNNDTPIPWEEVQKWFSYRSITLALQRQGLDVISPPTALLDNKYIIPPGKQLFIACNPPSPPLEGVSRQATLVVEQITSGNVQHKAVSPSFPVNQVNYFSWQANHSGDYRITHDLRNEMVEELILEEESERCPELDVLLVRKGKPRRMGSKMGKR